MSNTVKKPTRQWAAWTREEEESFFTALRQVGKVCYYCNVLFALKFSKCYTCVIQLQNFEKITRRVQSKNKDQVNCYEI